MQEGKTGKLEYLSCHYIAAWEFNYEYRLYDNKPE
jgi:hypothetical protein